MTSTNNQLPNQRWGWAVTFATCMTYAIVWGIPRSLSVVFTDFQDKFHSSNAATSWITSLIYGCFACGTLVGSFMSNLCGPRSTAMLGGMMSCTGAAIISQAPILQLVYLGSSLTGLGFGFAYSNATSQLSFYFDKKRPLVFGIASFGSPIGGMLLPLLISTTSATYGLEGSVLILGGIALHLSLCGALLRPVVIKDGESPEYPNNPQPMKQTKKSKSLPSLFMNDTSSICSIHDVIIQSQLTPKTLHKSTRREAISNTFQDMENSEMLNKDKECRDVVCDVDSRDVVCDVNSECISEKDMKKVEVRKADRIAVTLQVYISLCTDWRMMLFTLTGLLDFFVRFVPPWFIVTHVQRLGYNKQQGAHLILIFSVADGATKLILGFLLSKMPKKATQKGYDIFGLGFAQLMMALANIFMPFANRFFSLAIYMVAYGAGNGANSVWCMPIISRLVPIKYMVQAIGIFHFVSGIGILTGPPLAGYLADQTGDYLIVFYFAGAVFLISALLCWILFSLVFKFGTNPTSAGST